MEHEELWDEIKILQLFIGRLARENKALQERVAASEQDVYNLFMRTDVLRKQQELLLQRPDTVQERVAATERNVFEIINE